jgi:hypothetical protein
MEMREVGLHPGEPRHRRRNAEEKRAARGEDAAGDHHGPAALDQNDVPAQKNRQQSAYDHRDSKGEKGDDHAVSVTQRHVRQRRSYGSIGQRQYPGKLGRKKVESLAVALRRAAL